MTDHSPKYYYPQLDSIRGLSFLAVFFFHSYHPVWGTGHVNEVLQFFYHCLDYSIDVFFILSSFLLTWLGINEYERKGDFSFRNYFLRRALRIWPLYYILMFFSFVIVPLGAQYSGVHATLPPAAWYLFFVSNYYTPGHVYFLRFLWTLSVEEQFYLALGLCLLFFQKHLKMIILIFMGVSIVYNFYAVIKNVSSYFNTLTYLFDFAAGSLAAIALKENRGWVCRLRSLRKGQSFLFYLLLPMIFIMSFFISRQLSGISKDAVTECTRMAFILFIASFIVHQVTGISRFPGLAKNRFLIYTGKISYGLYCFHGIVLTFGDIALTKMHVIFPGLLRALILLAINYLIASGSYYLLEQPFLRIKNRLRRI